VTPCKVVEGYQIHPEDEGQITTGRHKAANFDLETYLAPV